MRGRYRAPSRVADFAALIAALVGAASGSEGDEREMTIKIVVTPAMAETWTESTLTGSLAGSVGVLLTAMEPDARAELAAHLLGLPTAEAIRDEYTGGAWRQVEAFLKARRDEHTRDDHTYTTSGAAWDALNDLLDDFREHMHTGTPLDQTVAGPHGEDA